MARETKGSITLSSDHMNYSRAVLNSNWHQARESEPKDYDISKGSERNLKKSTYKRIGNLTDGSLPETSYTYYSNQVYTKPDYEEQEPKAMINEDSPDQALDRDTGRPNKGSGAVLPSHNPEHDTFYADSTYVTDYGAPYEFTRCPMRPPDFDDHSEAYKRCLSQFSDTANHRRYGRNTFQDESGLYANNHLKRQAPAYKITDPLRAKESDIKPNYATEYVNGILNTNPQTYKKMSVLE